MCARGIARPVLTKEQLFAIGKRILEASTSDTVRAQIKHTARGVTLLANNRVLTSDNGDSLEITVQAIKGGRSRVRMTLNQVDDASLRAAVRTMDELARDQIGSPHDYMKVPDGPQEYMPVSLWHDSTA